MMGQNIWSLPKQSASVITVKKDFLVSGIDSIKKPAEAG
jgi:hypothetical protein